LPQIDTLAATYGDRGFVVLGINLWESPSTVQTYQNNYPDILMLHDVSGSVWDVYKIGGFIPLNYLLDHDFDQTVDYRSEGYSHGTISTRVLNLLSPVSVDLTLASPTIQQGTSLDYTVVLENHTASAQSFFAVVDVKLPSGSFFPLYPSAFSLTLSASEVKTYNPSYPLPGGGPAIGTYDLRVQLGTYPPELWMTDSETFEIVP